MAAGYCAAATELRWAGRYSDAVRYNLKAIGLAAGAPFPYAHLLMTCGWILLHPRPAQPQTRQSPA